MSRPQLLMALCLDRDPVLYTVEPAAPSGPVSHAD
jgi:hypothetical protein